MKSAAMQEASNREQPRSQAEWGALIANAPGEDRAPTKAELAAGVLVRGGGPEAVRAALIKRRGLGAKPAKEAVSLRLEAATLAGWKATGRGWQTRMAALLTQRMPKVAKAPKVAHADQGPKGTRVGKDPKATSAKVK